MIVNLNKILKGELLTANEVYDMFTSNEISLHDIENYAFEVMLKEKDRKILLEGFIGPILDCYARPYCLYCHRNSITLVELQLNDIINTLDYFVKRSCTVLELGNGSIPPDNGSRIINMIKEIEGMYDEVKV